MKTRFRLTDCRVGCDVCCWSCPSLQDEPFATERVLAALLHEVVFLPRRSEAAYFVFAVSCCTRPTSNAVMKWIDASSETVYWDAVFDRPSPQQQHSVAQKTTSNEDVVFVEEAVEKGSDVKWTLYCVCDGHGGAQAAEYIEKELWRTLEIRLPKKRPERAIGFASWTKQIRRAICEAFAEVDTDYTQKSNNGCDAGSTVTVALTCGWFLTVANLGDTEAVVDTGSEIELMTHSHRLEECEKERTRLTQAGVTLARLAPDLNGPAGERDAGRGPQRCWPGGLANSRSIGDLDGGQHIVSLPYIKQCILPHRGCRLIIGSDGLWDILDPETACKLTRPNCNKSSAERLVTVAIYRNNWAVHDDTTVLVIDFLSEKHGGFSQVCKNVRNSKKQQSPLLGCFCGSSVKDADAEEDTLSVLIPVAEEDCAVAGNDTITTELDRFSGSTSSTEFSDSVTS